MNVQQQQQQRATKSLHTFMCIKKSKTAHAMLFPSSDPEFFPHQHATTTESIVCHRGCCCCCRHHNYDHRLARTCVICQNAIQVNMFSYRCIIAINHVWFSLLWRFWLFLSLLVDGLELFLFCVCCNNFGIELHQKLHAVLKTVSKNRPSLDNAQ